MIKGIIVIRGVNFIRLEWTPPQYSPLQYLVSTQCSLQCNRELERYERVLPPIPGTHPSDGNPVTAVVIENLLPSSDCKIHFKAVYNPASLDPGVYIDAATLETSVYKWGTRVDDAVKQPYLTSLLVLYVIVHLYRKGKIQIYK